MTKQLKESLTVLTEHKTVQALILKYAQELGWHFVRRVEKRRGFDSASLDPEETP